MFIAGNLERPRFITGFRNDIQYMISDDIFRRHHADTPPDTIYFHTDAVHMEDIRPDTGNQSIFWLFDRPPPRNPAGNVPNPLQHFRDIRITPAMQAALAIHPSQVLIIAPNLTGTLDISHWLDPYVPVILYAPNLTVVISEIGQAAHGRVHYPAILFVRELRTRGNVHGGLSAAYTSRQDMWITLSNLRDDFDGSRVARYIVEHSSVTRTQSASDATWHNPGR